MAGADAVALAVERNIWNRCICPKYSMIPTSELPVKFHQSFTASGHRQSDLIVLARRRRPHSAELMTSVWETRTFLWPVQPQPQKFGTTLKPNRRRCDIPESLCVHSTQLNSKQGGFISIQCVSIWLRWLARKSATNQTQEVWTLTHLRWREAAVFLWKMKPRKRENREYASLKEAPTHRKCLCDSGNLRKPQTLHKNSYHYQLNKGQLI